jgi:hypothetical protein
MDSIEEPLLDEDGEAAFVPKPVSVKIENKEQEKLPGENTYMAEFTPSPSMRDPNFKSSFPLNDALNNIYLNSTSDLRTIPGRFGHFLVMFAPFFYIMLLSWADNQNTLYAYFDGCHPEGDRNTDVALTDCWACNRELPYIEITRRAAGAVAMVTSVNFVFASVVMVYVFILLDRRLRTLQLLTLGVYVSNLRRKAVLAMSAYSVVAAICAAVDMLSRSALFLNIDVRLYLDNNPNYPK